jgi:hypothetical protein
VSQATANAAVERFVSHKASLSGGNRRLLASEATLSTARLVDESYMNGLLQAVTVVDRLLLKPCESLGEVKAYPSLNCDLVSTLRQRCSGCVYGILAKHRRQELGVTRLMAPG